MSKLIKVEREVPDLSYELIEGIIKHLQGQILTITEAVLPEDRVKATKSLIKHNFNETLSRTFEIFMDNGLVKEEQIPDYEE